MMPNPTLLTAPSLGAGAPPPSPPTPANDGSPETVPAAGRPAGGGPLDPAGRGPAEATPPAPPAAEADAPAPPRDTAQRAAFDALRLALQEGHVFAALTGPAGTGKTAVLDAALASRSNRRLRIIRIVEADRVTAELAARIERVAQAEATKPANADAHVVLAVDDAHAASDELLRCLTRLAAAERTARLPQIFLAGRPGLWDRLAAEEYAPLAVRLAVRPVLHPEAPEDPWAAIEQDLARARAGAPPGAERTPDARPGAARRGSAPPGMGLLGAGPPDPAPLDSAAPPADDAPGSADPAVARPRGGVLVPFVVLLAVAGAGLYALARHDWSPERLAVAAWAEAGRHISVTQAPRPEPAAVHPAPVPDRSPTAPPMFPEPEPVADAVPTPAEAGAPVRDAALTPDVVPAPHAALTPDAVPAPHAAFTPDAVRAPHAVPAPDAVFTPDAARAPDAAFTSDVVPAPHAALTPDAVPVPPRSTPVPAPVSAPSLAPVSEGGGAGDPKAPLPAVQDVALPEASLPPAPAEPAPASPPRSENRRVAAVALPTQPGLLALLLRHGDERLALGDLSAARLFYARAASLGSAQAARLVARTYDRAFLDPANAGAAADASAALAWYRRAAALGDAEAADWLRRSDAGR